MASHSVNALYFGAGIDKPIEANTATQINWEPSTGSPDVVFIRSSDYEEIRKIMKNFTPARGFLGSPVFSIVFSKHAILDCAFRENCSNKALVNMVTFDAHAVDNAFKQIIRQKSERGRFQCNYCGLAGLTEDNLWTHAPFYHINTPNKSSYGHKCPICSKKTRRPMQVHIRNHHGLCANGKVHRESNKSVELSPFALVVVRRKKDGRYLIVQEFARSGFWLPGGRTDAGESLQDSAIRETKEEAGVDIKLKGILQF